MLAQIAAVRALKIAVMKKRDTNKMKMYNQVVLIVSEHTSLWQANVPFAETYAAFTEKLVGLREAFDAQFALKGNFSAHKKRTIHDLVVEALRIQNAMIFFAANTQDLELLELVRHTPTSWKQTSENKRLAMANQLRTQLAAHLSEVQAYGLGQADLDQLDARIADCANALTEPRSSIVHRAQITQSIDSKVAELDSLLKTQLDPYVLSLKNAHPDFVNLYHNAREIVHYKGKGSHPDASDNTTPDAA